MFIFDTLIVIEYMNNYFQKCKPIRFTFHRSSFEIGIEITIKLFH